MTESEDWRAERAERAEYMYQKALTAYQQVCERAERAEAEVERLQTEYRIYVDAMNYSMGAERALADQLAEALDELRQDASAWALALAGAALTGYEEARRG